MEEGLGICLNSPKVNRGWVSMTISGQAGTPGIISMCPGGKILLGFECVNAPLYLSVGKSLFTNMHWTSRNLFSIGNNCATGVGTTKLERSKKQLCCLPRYLFQLPLKGSFGSLSSTRGGMLGICIHSSNSFKSNCPRSWITLVNVSEYYVALQSKRFQIRFPKDRPISSSEWKKAPAK